MKASEQYILYQDLIGDAVADLAKQPSSNESNLQYFTKKFKIDSKRFKVVGIELYGLQEHSLTLICEDLTKSNEAKIYISNIEIPCDKFNIEDILEGLHIILYDKNAEMYKNLESDEIIQIDDLVL